MASLINKIISFYQYFISPLMGPNCRYYPSCSEYTKICFQNFPIHKAMWYSTSRIFKCHPMSAGGFDPPPCECIDRDRS